MGDLSTMYANATSPFERLKRRDADGEWWSARDLMGPLGYSTWQKFGDAIDRATISARSSGADVMSNFIPVTGSGNWDERDIFAPQEKEDFRLTRYAAYLIAMNGDVRKPEISAAQQYFAAKTRQAEVSEYARPKTRVELVRELLASEEALEAAENARIEAEAARRAIEPAANAWTTLASSEGDFSVGDTAKILSRDHGITIGQNRLFEILAHFGWLYRSRADRSWRVMQVYVNNGCAVEKIQSHTHPRTGEQIIDAPQVRITPKGILTILHQHRKAGWSPVQPKLTITPAIP